MLQVNCLILLTVVVVVSGQLTSDQKYPLEAVAIVESGDGKVKGFMEFIQSTPGGPVTMKLHFRNLTPGLHGFHIHENSIKSGCLSAGSHFNPNHNAHHGKSDVFSRHTGDLGNIMADENGAVEKILVDSVIQLSGPASIINRSFVIHAQKDDLGMGADDESKKTGNSGARIGCGTISLK